MVRLYVYILYHNENKTTGWFGYSNFYTEVDFSDFQSLYDQILFFR